MKKLLAIALFSVFVSCTPGMHPEYEQNTETVKAFLKLQGEETDVNAQMALVHEELAWQPAFHGATPIGKEDFRAYLLNWQDVMEETVYTPRNYLPGVFADTGLQDGSVRSYGKWTGVHSATGKKWELTAYHTWDFKDGKIISGGDYFDAGGLIASLQVEEVSEEISEE
jgi:ketosteroid isomerase-like protein